MPDKEMCCDCGYPTGRAGKSEDSIYSAEGAGPFCPDCWDEGHAIDRRIKERDDALRMVQHCLLVVPNSSFKSDASDWLTKALSNI